MWTHTCTLHTGILLKLYYTYLNLQDMISLVYKTKHTFISQTSNLTVKHTSLLFTSRGDTYEFETKWGKETMIKV